LAGNIARECPIKQKFSTFLPTETQIFHFFWALNVWIAKMLNLTDSFCLFPILLCIHMSAHRLSPSERFGQFQRMEYEIWDVQSAEALNGRYSTFSMAHATWSAYSKEYHPDCSSKKPSVERSLERHDLQFVRNDSMEI
jgi:hypothetical protein